MNHQDSFLSSTDSEKPAFSFWQYSRVLDYIAFCGFLLLLTLGLWHHELWGDELHSWNLARSSSSLNELLKNIRYEGHPPFWYLLLFLTSKISSNMAAIKVLHFIVVFALACLLVFRMHIYSIHKVLILAGYYFLYEYGVLSRNYALAIVFALGIVLLRNRDSKYDAFFYYMLLFFLAATHILGLFLGLALHFAFTIKHFSTWYSRKAFLEMLFGVLIVLPLLYFIFPPSSSSLNLGFWKDHWSSQQLKTIADAPLKAFLPVPAWWQYNSWNTEFLLSFQQRYPIFRLLNLMLSISAVYLVYFLLKPHRLSLNVFFVNLVLTMLFAVVFPLTSMRYVGFIFIGFIVSLLIGYHTLIQFRQRRILIWMLLLLQVLATIPSYIKDIKFPFSHAPEVRTVLAAIDPKLLVTDYWTLNYISAAINKPAYCVGYNEEKRFLLWDQEMTRLMKDKKIYTEGFNVFFKKSGADRAYFLTNDSIEGIMVRDGHLRSAYELTLLDKRVGAIERYSNLFLFRVTPLYPGEQ